MVSVGRSKDASRTEMERVRLRKLGWLSEIVCSPVLAFNEHGVMQAVPSRPSKTAVAPGGWLFTIISTECVGRVISFLGTAGRRGGAGFSSSAGAGWGAGSETSGLVSGGGSIGLGVGGGAASCFIGLGVS